MTIRELRIKNQMTQEELSSKLGLTRGAITMIETGKNRLTVDTAKKIADVFGIDWKDLFDWFLEETLWVKFIPSKKFQKFLNATLIVFMSWEKRDF